MNKSILWVEDDIDIISAVVEPLRDLGIRIVGCRNYSEALEYVKDASGFDLIMLDLILPPGNISAQDEYLGLVLLRQLRRDFDIQIPVLVFSVVANMPEISYELALLNATALRKPVRPSQLKRTVLEILELAVEPKDVS